MQFLKSLMRGLASLGFKSGLFFLAIVSVTCMVIGTSTALKQALKNSKIYDNLIDNVISMNAQEGNDKTSDSSIALNGAQVTQAAKTAFDSKLIQNTSEQIIDSVYRWLHGQTAKPDFRIDLSEPKLRFATAAAENAAARARSLPACTLSQSRELATTQIDPFTVQCLPQGLDINVLRNKVISDLANNEELLKSPVITIDSLPKNDHGKTALDSASQAPKIFQKFLMAPWILGGLTLVSAIALVTLYDEKRRGIRAVGVIALGSGVFLALGTLILSYAVKYANKPSGPLGKLSKNALQTNFAAILESLSTAFTSKLLLFAAGYAAFGVTILLVLHFTESQKPGKTMPHEPPDAETNSTAIASDRSAVKPVSDISFTEQPKDVHQ